MSTSGAPPVTIDYLVLTYRRPESLDRLLRSVAAQGAAPGAARVLVWDNDPASPGPPAALAALGGQGLAVEYRRSLANLKMRARRQLEEWSFADGPERDVIVHLDDDVVLCDGWLGGALAALDAGYDACGSVEYHGGERICSGQTSLDIDRMRWPIPIWHWRWEAAPRGTTVVPAAFAGHRAMAVRGGAARRAPHDEAYAIGGEDLDYSLGLARAGARIALSGAAEIRHRAGGEPDAAGFRVRDDVIASWRHFFGKWGFVRGNAAEEAGLDMAAWVALFTSQAR